MANMLLEAKGRIVHDGGLTAAKDSESSVHGEMMGQPESSESSSPPKCQEKIRPITTTGKFFEKNNGAERESQETFT